MLSEVARPVQSPQVRDEGADEEDESMSIWILWLLGLLPPEEQAIKGFVWSD